ncbi:arrestin domain-containing protein 3-like [Asterias amurensis]|uniref:arrestin domain-containing protein 3-like n=1 Tax=Asterias amurensis TaxID=7602 RepID=UPI003AB311F2
MPNLQHFEVIFDGDVSIFKPGDYVRGFIRIVLGAQKNDVRGIQIKIQGKANTHWTERHNKNTRHYSAKEIYFKERVICFGKDKRDPGASKVCMEAGEHHFPFTFQIPYVPLPYPFEGCSGWIRYKLKCKIDRPWKFNHTVERLFSVIGQPIDLNLMQIARYPLQGNDSKTVCLWCCASGPILTTALTDKAAYVAGEPIFVSCNIENNSNRNIIDITVKLIQRVSFHSTVGKTKEVIKLLVQINGSGCGAGETASMVWSPLLIPAVPPSGPLGCLIMKIEYEVEIVVHVSHTPFDTSVILPVIIGTVPLHQPCSPQATNCVITQQPSANDGVQSIDVAHNSNFGQSTPPPSYELAMDGLQEIPSKSGHDYTFGKLMYAPQYPTYSMPTNQPTWDPMNPPQGPGPVLPGFSHGLPPPGVLMHPSVDPPPPGGSGAPPPPGGSGAPPPPGGSGYPPQDKPKY